MKKSPSKDKGEEVSSIQPSRSMLLKNQQGQWLQCKTQLLSQQQPHDLKQRHKLQPIVTWRRRPSNNSLENTVTHLLLGKNMCLLMLGSTYHCSSTASVLGAMDPVRCWKHYLKDPHHLDMIHHIICLLYVQPCFHSVTSLWLLKSSDVTVMFMKAVWSFCVKCCNILVVIRRWWTVALNICTWSADHYTAWTVELHLDQQLITIVSPLSAAWNLSVHIIFFFLHQQSCYGQSAWDDLCPYTSVWYEEMWYSRHVATRV